MLVLPRDWQAKLHTNTVYASVQAAKDDTLAAFANVKKKGTNYQLLNTDADVGIKGLAVVAMLRFGITAAEEDTVGLGSANAHGG